MRYVWPLVIFGMISFFLAKGFSVPAPPAASPVLIEKDLTESALILRQNTMLNVAQLQLFDKIIRELRCMVCQNQRLSDSLAPIAIQLRQDILEQIKEGNSEKDVIAFVTQKFGDFILYEPPLRLGTSLLWFGPFVLLVVALMMVRRQFRSKAYSPK